MFVSFSVENFRSYKYLAELSFIVDSNKPVSRNNLGNKAIIFGGNASGKSNLFKAIFCSRLFFVEKKFEGNAGTLPLYAPHEDKKPIIFKYCFLDDKDQLYTYQFSIAEGNKIDMERLYINNQLVFELIGSKLTIEFSDFQNKSSTDWLKVFQKNLPNERNSLILQSLDQFGGSSAPDYVKFIYSEFRKIHCFDTNKFDLNPFPEIAVGNLQDSDIEPITKLLKIADNSFDKIINSPLDDRIEVLHKSNKSEYKVPLKQETGGLLKLILLYDFRKQGAYFFIDELDTRMHYQLVNYFLRNVSDNQQWALTSHNIGVLESEFEDNCYFTVTKNDIGVSNLRRISDIKYKDQGLSRLEYYLQGSLQGQPGFLSNDLETMNDK